MKFSRKYLEASSILPIIVIICIIGFFGFNIYTIYHNYQEQIAITSGYVIDKNYNAPYVSYRSHSSKEHSTSTPVYHEATYMILVKSDDELHTAWYEVTPLIYDRIKVGDHLNNVNRELK